MEHNRREFLATSAFAVSSLCAAVSTGGAAQGETFRCAVIGHTGRGDFGHEMDMVFTGRDDCELLAVTDPDDAGRAKAAQRSGAPRQYADYREMLAKEKPQLVAVAPRHSDQRREMAVAALAAGAHVFTEKPFAPSPADADQILAAADSAKRKVAVAHQMRLAPSIARLTKAMKDGLIGELLAIEAWGKQDASRTGGEDMMVLGTHLFDLMRHFAGDPQWCTARVLHRGRDITKEDRRATRDAIGYVAGDEVSAHFAFPNGVNGSFTSRAKLRDVTGPWGIKLTGSKGVVRLLTEVEPRVMLLKATTWSAAGRSEEWKPLDDVPIAHTDFPVANRRVIDDWIAAIRANREPTCSGRNAAAAVEMVMSVYGAALSGARVTFPLKDRKHALE